MYIILKIKLSHYTKELAKLVTIIISGFLIILAMIIIKYKPVYKVTVAGEKLGYINNLNQFKEVVENEIINQEGKNIANVSFVNEPEYELTLLARANTVNNQEVIEQLKNDTVIIYKYYEVALNNETKAYVDTIEDATKIVNEIKEEFNGNDLELNLQINEKYTENKEEIYTDSIEIAENTVETAAKEIKEKSEAIAIINNVKLSYLPVSGRISSRYGERSSLRRSTHTGLDIACESGTDIKVVSSGTITFSGRAGAYGNLIKVDHGQGVETWYGHCSKLYAKEGDTVNAGDVIAAVGSTGNSTGPHLHFEIRIDSKTVNPQNYVY